MFKQFIIKDEIIEELKKIEKEYANNENYKQAQYFHEVVEALIWINKTGIKQKD